MKRSYVLALGLSRVLLLGACVGEVPTEADERSVDTSPVIVETNGRWSNRKNIPVCFTGGDGTSAMEQGTRKVIESEYAKVGICFSGWGRCSASTPCPAIRIEYGPPNAENQGTAGWSYVGQPSWFCNAGDWQKPTMWLRNDQWDWAAVHEFGHAIGMQHEHARTDNNGKCDASKNEQIADDGDTDYIGPYDDSSVMCYCSGRSRLSALDIQGIKQFYGVGNDLSCGAEPAPGDFKLSWSSAGPIAGMTCTQITEPADPNTWTDNYVCANKDLGLRWSHSGAIAGMTCTKVHEGSDPHGWDNNFLCAPRDLGLKYSSAGPIAGLQCTQLNEGSDPHTWNDNYLCKPDGNFTLSFSYVGSINGRTCVNMNEPTDPGGWNDNFVCTDRDIGLRFSAYGAIAGMSCTSVAEPSDPNNWHDNFVCTPADRGLRFSNAGPIPGMRCVSLNEPADPHTWNDNYLCQL